MAMRNKEIAARFTRLADLLEVEDANPYRVRAYRNAARTLNYYSHSIADLIEQGEDLTNLPNIGKDLAEKIETLVRTGRLPLLEEVESRTPVALSELMDIEGLGPKRVKTLYRELNVESLDDLKRAARKGRVRDLEGFGRKTEEAILKRVERFAGADRRFKRIDAEDIAESLVEYLGRSRDVKDIVVAGSYRRCKETVGDLDILVTARRGSGVMDDFVDYDEVETVVSHGNTRSTVQLRSGLQVDLRVVPEVSYGAALHYFTGGKDHNVAVRRLGVKKGYKINEYGVFEGEERIAGKTERAVYDAVDLPYIPPELRENRGEIEAARNGDLPTLVELADIRGDLHCHTRASDGHDSLRRMAEAARDRGYDYLAISDHSKQVRIANGLDEDRLARQIDDIDALNDELDDIVLLKAIEVDILEDGTLDLPDRILEKLDLRVCSVHYNRELSRKKMTERVIKAMDNPHFNILGHPTGRLINGREAFEIDLEKVMAAALERGCHLEINAQPDRLDLDDSAAKMAREMGLKLAIDTDAHSAAGLGAMRYGVEQGRRGWLEADNVINTRSLSALRKLLERS